jgi:hypothetical protein
LTFDWAKVFKIEAEFVINTKMSGEGFGNLIKTVWPEKFVGPIPELRKPQTEQWESTARAIQVGRHPGEHPGTVWAGYQSIVEYLYWQMPVTGVGDLEVAAQVRATWTKWAMLARGSDGIASMADAKRGRRDR